MRVRSFGVNNYKSFSASDHVELEAGFNVVVGQNNVGKTALAEALSLRFEDKPHRSPETVPIPSAEPRSGSNVQVVFELDGEELVGLLGRESPEFHVPLETRNVDGIDLQDEARKFVEAVSGTVLVEGIYGPDGLKSAHVAAYGGRLSASAGSVRSMKFRADVARGSLNLSSKDMVTVGVPATLPLIAARVLRERVYNFQAERTNAGEAPAQHAEELAPDASNLVQCLHTLQSNVARFRRLNGLVSEIFPEIQQVTVPLTPMGRARVVVWTFDPASEREDLAVPLSESGTGVGHVLAMLFVVLTAEYPRTIIIDEPQSYLHPGAVRKLMGILKHYQRHRHQYVITTHSPAVITAADPRRILLVGKKGAESTVRAIDAAEARNQSLLLKEVGARLSDVFGADNVLWVEGPTEEECFPLVLSEMLGRPLLGTKILAVMSTGDLEGRRSRDAYRLYNRLSQGGGLVPPAVGFVFDREGRTDKDLADLDRESGGLVAFLPRRMYENYLLKPSAIASVASGVEGFRQDSIEAGEVAVWIEENGGAPKYSKGGTEGPFLESLAWLAEVDAARLLKDLFDELSESRVAYDKIVHGAALTRWLCENEPEDLQEVANIIVERLDRGEAPQAECTE